MDTKDKKEKKRRGEAKSPVEFYCPSCKESFIIYVPADEQIKCPRCHKFMVMKELLVEGKSC